MHLRLARASRGTEVPELYEGLKLRAWARLSAWLCGLVFVTGGIAVMVSGDGALVELTGALGAAIGAVVLAGVIRCARFEIILGKEWLRIGAGPFTHRMKWDLVRDCTIRPSTGWRRLFADREIVFSLGFRDQVHLAPSNSPEEVRSYVADPPARSASSPLRCV